MDPSPEVGFSIGFTIAELMKAVLVGVGTVTLWLLKKLGDTHVASLDSLLKGQARILEEVSGLNTRISVLESQLKSHLHQDDTN